MDALTNLRPFERRVARLAEGGMVPDEIGRRFRKSGGFIERVIELAGLDGRHADSEPGRELNPLERRLLRWRDEGASPAELADRFRRGPEHIERVLAFADFKQERNEVSDTR